MAEEYSTPQLVRTRSVLHRIKTALLADHASPASRRAFDTVFTDTNSSSIYLAVGGGPRRTHRRHINLNIGQFENVDVVGDAHSLPVRDRSVDAIYCEAVLEHLRRPTIAVSEMFRVVKPGGIVWACTPFLQPFHGYPSHYQNFTLTGHRALFEDAGFVVTESGACVGPVAAILTLVHTALQQYVPFGRAIALAWAGLTLPLRPLDRLLWRQPHAHVVASTTYLVAHRPPGNDCQEVRASSMPRA